MSTQYTGTMMSDLSATVTKAITCGICPKCQRFEHHAFCPDCGTPREQFIQHDCVCGEHLSRYQKFCAKCGRAAPEINFPTPPEYTIMDKIRDEAVSD